MYGLKQCSWTELQQILDYLGCDSENPRLRDQYVNFLNTFTFYTTAKTKEVATIVKKKLPQTFVLDAAIDDTVTSFVLATGSSTCVGAYFQLGNEQICFCCNLTY